MNPIDFDAIRKLQQVAYQKPLGWPQFPSDVELALRLMAIRPALSAEDAIGEARKMLSKRHPQEGEEE